MNEELLEIAKRWRDDDVDDENRRELDGVIAARDPSELRERFGGKLEFGTAGLRGVLGAGTNRMNRAVVIRTTAGLAAHVLASFPDAKERGVVIGRDARRGSAEFARDAAEVLAAHGIVAHVFEEIVPTPLVAFAVKDLGAVAGVMVTASHNPPEYNGYKVYWANGAQIVPPHDQAIAAAIDATPGARHVPRAAGSSLVRPIGPELFARYVEAVAGESRTNEGRDAITIVYTPMHGVGDRYAHAVLARFGFTRVLSVPEQAKPDGAFPTVRFPNPEEPGALDLALALAKKENADVLLANDPDADRLAAAIPDNKGGFVALNGNELGVLLGHYALTESTLPAKDRLVVTTIVSSPLLGMIARALGARCEEVLTGFKWITNRAMDVERQTGAHFLMGYEEALGYTLGTVVRDKDGVSAAAIFAELVATSKARGEAMLDRLERIYRTFGLVVSRQHNVVRKGTDGAAAIKREMAAMRAAPPAEIGGVAVVAVRDYLGKKGVSSELPPSDVLAFELADGARVTMRPSGTEPKIKYYLDVRAELSAAESFVDGRARAMARLDALEREFVALAAKHGGGA